MPMGRQRTCKRLADLARWPALRMMTLVQGHSSATTSGWRFPAATSTRCPSRRTTGPTSKRTTARRSITNNRCWVRSAGRAPAFDNRGQRGLAAPHEPVTGGMATGPSLLSAFELDRDDGLLEQLGAA